MEACTGTLYRWKEELVTFDNNNDDHSNNKKASREICTTLQTVMNRWWVSFWHNRYSAGLVIKDIKSTGLGLLEYY